MDGQSITVPCSPQLGGTLVSAAQQLKHDYDPPDLCGKEGKPNDEDITALDQQGAASPMEVEGELPDMNAEVLHGDVNRATRYCQRWRFLNL